MEDRSPSPIVDAPTAATTTPAAPALDGAPALNGAAARHRPRLRDDELILDEVLPVEEIERRCLKGQIVKGLRHRSQAFYLRLIERRRLHLLRGHRSVVDHAVSRMGFSPSEARDLLRVGRRLEELRRIDKAFDEGRVCWSKVREIVRVATVETEERWLEKAMRSPIGEVTLAVRLALPGEPPRDPDERKGLPEMRLRIDAQVPPDVYAKWEKVKEKLEDQAGRPLREWECLEALCDLGLSLRDDGSVPGKVRMDESRYAVVVHCGGGCECAVARPSAERMVVCPAGVAAVATDDGPVPIAQATAEMIACDECVHHPDAPANGRGHGERHGHGHANGKADRYIPAHVRRAVMARDGHRCRCCGSRLSPQLHHVEARGQGGPHEGWNLLCVCRMCHTLIHAGFIVVEFLEKDGRKVGFRFADREGRELHAPHDDLYRRLIEELDDSLVRLSAPREPFAEPLGATQCATRRRRVGSSAAVTAKPRFPRRASLYY